VGCHLKDAPPLQEGRTSQYAHASKLITYAPFNALTNPVFLLMPHCLLGFYFNSNMSPHVPLFLPLLIFIDFI
jgi:hypothetical protein